MNVMKNNKCWDCGLTLTLITERMEKEKKEQERLEEEKEEQEKWEEKEKQKLAIFI
jgi:hypothetical protein